MINPKPYLIKNWIWAVKGTSAETGINLFRIFGKQNQKLASQDLKYSKICLQVDNVNVIKFASNYFFYDKF